MLGGKFIVSFQEKTLFILDPRNGTAVGVATLQDNIKSVVASGGFLYVLSNVLLRVAVHHSYVTMEYEPKRLLNSALSTPCTSVGNSPLGSLENLAKEALPGSTKEQSDSRCASKPPSARDEPAGDDAGVVSTVVVDCEGVPDISVSIPAAGSLPVGRECASPCLQSSEWECQHVVITGPESTAHAEEQPLDSSVFDASKKSEPEKCDKQSNDTNTDGEDESPTVSRSVESRKGLKIELLKLTPEKLSSMLSFPSPDKAMSSREENSDEGEGIDAVKEQARRLRMAQAAGDDIIADNKSHHKRRKRTKGKKISSAASKFHCDEITLKLHCSATNCVRFYISVHGKVG